MRKLLYVGSLTFLAIVALAIAAQSASAGNYSYAVQEGRCVQVGSVYGGTWSMTSSAPFQGAVVPSNGAYRYGPRIATEHGGTGPSSANYYYTACNVCPVGTITVDFALPDPAINGGAASYFDAPNTDTSACSTGSPLGFDFGLGGLPQFLGGLGLVIAIVVIIVVIAIPAPAARGGAPAGPAQPPWQPKPRLVPMDWTYPVAGQAKVMARGNEPLNPTDEIGVYHPVPVDAPRQAVAGTHPLGSRTTCTAPPGCGQLTLTLFQQGWFCTNVQCPLRNPGTGQTTTLVDMNI